MSSEESQNSVTLSNDSESGNSGEQLAPSNGASASDLSPSGTSVDTMQEYYRLQQNLLICTLGFTVVIFLAVWASYSLHIALNYLLGACTGVVYLKMLAKNVAELGRQRQKLGSGRLALFAGLIIFATQYQQLEVLPVFLGFLTYKVTLIAYTLWTAVLTESA